MTRFNTRLMGRVLALSLVVAVVAGCAPHGGQGNLVTGARDQADGKYRSAYIEAKKVLQHDAGNGDAWLLLGKASLMQGNPDDALHDLKKAKANAVPIERWAVPMAQALTVTHHYQELLKILPEGQSFKPSVAAHVATSRGDAYRGLQQYAAAKKAYQAALQANPKTPRALVGLASLAIQDHDLTGADKYVQQALTVAPKSSQAWAGKGELAMVEGNLPGAESAYDKALALNTRGWLPQDRYLTRLQLASVQLRQQQFEKATANIKTLEKLSPQQPQPHYLHAVVLYRQGQLDDAVSQLQQVLKVSPDSAAAQLLMGAVNYAKGNYSQAQMYLSNVLGMDHESVSARKLLALTFYREGRSNSAVNTLRPVMPGKPSDAVLLAQLQKAVAQGAGMPPATKTAVDGHHASVLASAASSGKPESDGKFAGVDAALARHQPAQAVRMLKAMPKGDAAFEARRTMLLVRALVDDKHVAEAVKTASDYAAANPDNAGAQILYGSALVVDHQYDQARAQYGKAQKLSPDTLAIRMNLGSLDVVQHRYKDAKRHFMAVLHDSPHSATAMTALGNLAVAQHDRAGAIKWFKQAIAAQPQYPGAYMPLILLYSGAAKFDQAVAVAGKLVQVDPDNAAALNALGSAQLNAGHAEKALAPLAAAVKRAPKVSGYRINLARAQIILDDPESAADNLKQVVQNHPTQVQAVQLLAFLKLHEHDLPGALALAHALQKRNSTKSAGYALAGDLYMANKSYADAAKAYQAGLKVHADRPLVLKQFAALQAGGVKQPETGLVAWLAKYPKDAAMRMVLAEYYMGHAQTRKAVSQYQRVLKAYPSNVAALNNLAWLYVGEHDPKGLAIAKRAHDLAPTSPGVADTYGWALIVNHQAKAALPVLQQAVKAAPGAPTIRYHLALAQMHTGDRHAARVTLAALTRPKADFPQRQAAEKLYRKLGGTSTAGANK